MHAAHNDGLITGLQAEDTTRRVAAQEETQRMAANENALVEYGGIKDVDMDGQEGVSEQD